MTSPKDLEAARNRWRQLAAHERARLSRLVAGPELEARARERLREILLDRRAIREALGSPHSGEERERLKGLLERASSPLFGVPPGGEGSVFASAVCQQLVALALPLAGHDDERTDGLPGLLERAGAHEVLGQAAMERALQLLADDLLGAAGEELVAKVRSIRRRPGPPPSIRWTSRPDRLLLSVDHVTLSCARYLAGLQAPERDRYGYDELQAGRGGRAKRVEQVTVKFDPASTPLGSATGPRPVGAAPAGPRGTTEGAMGGSELKAKLFVALFALAARAKSQGEAGPLRVRARDLMAMLGFELGTLTNSGYYWRYARQVTRYLLFDLPGRVVAMQLQIAGEREPRVVFESLLERAVPLDAKGGPLDEEVAQTLYEGLRGESGRAVRAAGVEGFEFAVSDDLLEAHGIGKPLNAVEHVPVEVLSLKGPAFWLAWQVAFLRRWATPPAGGGQGKPLLRALEETGHLAASTRSGRVRYRDALGNWWRDAGELATLGLLDEPGVRLYAKRGGAWREVSTELSRSLDASGTRLTRSNLEGVRVVYLVPRSRVARLQEARRKGARRASGVPRA